MLNDEVRSLTNINRNLGKQVRVFEATIPTMGKQMKTAVRIPPIFFAFPSLSLFRWSPSRLQLDLPPSALNRFRQSCESKKSAPKPSRKRLRGLQRP